MQNRVRLELTSRTYLNHGDDLRPRLAHCPHPQRLPFLFDIRPQLIQLDMTQVQIPKEALVQFSTLRSATCQPCPQRTLLDPNASCNADTSIPNTNKFIAKKMIFDKVFSRYNKVHLRIVNFVSHNWQYRSGMRSYFPCDPYPIKAWILSSATR